MNDITADFLIQQGAKRINNSMLRIDDYTFQNHCNLSRLFNLEKHYQGFKVCYKGRFLKCIYVEKEWLEIIEPIKN